MKKAITILMIIASLPLFSQGDKIDSLLNDLIYNDTESDLFVAKVDPVKYDFIYVGSNYNSNTYYAGREIGSNMFSISEQLYYFNSTGIFIGASGNWYDQLTPGYNSTTFSAGYNTYLGKKKKISFQTSYSYFLYNSDSTAVYPYTSNVSMGLYYRNKWFRARLSGNYMFGDETAISLSPAIYSRFKLFKIGKHFKVYTAPEISFYFGTETILIAGPPNRTLEYEDVFGLLNTQLQFPLIISIGDFDIDMTYSLNLPYTQDKSESYDTNSLYSISIAYMLPIEKKKKSSRNK